MINDTEMRLLFWRDGSTKAERLAGAILRLSGYEEVDPQSPLGGPDGKKDIICRKGGLTWVGAVYFPTGPVTFATTRKKFTSDLVGAPSEHPGFAFVTNQSLTPRQRETLAELAKSSNKEPDIIHLQRLQNHLDSAPGYGVRIQYLGIPMTIEEQLSWASDSDTQTAKALTVNTREIFALRASIERLGSGQKTILRTIAQGMPTAAPAADLISVSAFARNDEFSAVTASLTPELVILFHRLLCFDLPARIVGRLRTEQVWLGDLEGKRAAHIQPPPAVEVPWRLSSLCSDWVSKISKDRTTAKKLHSIAEFHAGFLFLHPFLDGNGRVARAILMQQCLDLFGKADMTLMNKGADYYAALQAADFGDYTLLVKLIEPIIRS